MRNSLDYYRQAAADSDDSDCDLLEQKPVFQSRKKPKQNETDSPSSVSLSQSSLESNSSTPSQQTVSPKPVFTEEQIEAKAQEMIKDLTYPALGGIKNTNQLGWHKAPKKKGSKEKTWYPCRLATADEGIGLVQKYSKKMLVRYLGFQIPPNEQYGEIKAKDYIPLTEENKESGMETYKRHLLEKRFKGNVVLCKAEVLAVIEIWRRVKEREEESTSDKSSTEERTQTNTQSSLSVEGNANLIRTQSDCGESSDEGGSDSDLDMEDAKDRTASNKAPLRAGDVIEYYDPIGVAGNSQWLKTALIVGVVAKGTTFPLNLDSGDLLDRTVRVKRVKRRYRQKLETCHDAAFKGISEYGLKSSGTMEMLAMKAKVERTKRIRDECDSQVQEFWKANSPESMEESHGVNNSNASISPRLRLSTLLEHIGNKQSKNTQYVPPTPPEELEVVISVWECLEQKIDAANNKFTTKSIVPLLASRLHLELESLDEVLRGEGKTLCDMEKMKVINALKSWLADPCLNFEEHMTGTGTTGLPMMNGNNRRLSRPLAQRNQNTYKEESKRK